ncbi:MAG: 1-acyl-sn-glycerol-3-phosphate acyltransferase [Saprospiraceae bacterium]|nr:1-acyl-sn-glycerol-3-phosphate acyltransferase [Saprospiraceae bacterium]
MNKIKLRGYVDETRSLFTKGTVVIVPTHFSNLDSITIGYALDMVAGMPALSYGAGLNLFEVEIVAYFINRLGAYKVDRRKKNPVYLECLTSMASYALYKGVPNIFFPGGTRSRSGALENKLKYGLLGSAIEAQRLMMENGKQDKIYIVPLVISYNFVLEAKSLIEQHLMAIGKEKYQRSRESKNIGSKWNYFKLFFSKQSEMVLSFGEPMDVLGNRLTKKATAWIKLQPCQSARVFYARRRTGRKCPTRIGVHPHPGREGARQLFPQQRGFVKPPGSLCSLPHVAQPTQRPQPLCHAATQCLRIFYQRR